MGDFALTHIGLRDKAAALRLSEQAMATLPIERDAIRGPVLIDILARVAAEVGEPDRAIAALQKLLSIPSDAAGPYGQPAAYSRAAPTRSDVRSAPE